MGKLMGLLDDNTLLEALPLPVGNILADLEVGEEAADDPYPFFKVVNYDGLATTYSLLKGVLVAAKNRWPYPRHPEVEKWWVEAVPVVVSQLDDEYPEEGLCTWYGCGQPVKSLVVAKALIVSLDSALKVDIGYFCQHHAEELRRISEMPDETTALQRCHAEMVKLFNGAADQLIGATAALTCGAGLLVRLQERPVPSRVAEAFGWCCKIGRGEAQEFDFSSPEVVSTVRVAILTVSSWVMGQLYAVNSTAEPVFNLLGALAEWGLRMSYDSLSSLNSHKTEVKGHVQGKQETRQCGGDSRESEEDSGHAQQLRGDA